MSWRRKTTWEIHRPTPTADGSGGQTIALVQVGAERGDVRTLTGRERFELQQAALRGQQAGAEHTHRGWFRARADIKRNDELRRGGERLEVVSVASAFPEGPQASLLVSAKSIEAGD